MFGLFRRSGSSAHTGAAGYGVFTRRFDLEIRAEHLDQVIGTEGKAAWKAYVEKYDAMASGWLASANLAAVNAVGALRASTKGGQLADTVACLLIDHSGSLRGQRAIVACALTQVVADFWHRLGIAYEILGFTTRSWHGGKSRLLWRAMGKPRNPGRLCGLLHIIYRDAQATPPGAPWAIRNLLRQELLKENVDGEALLWGVERLKAGPEKRKLLFIVSDGKPVDDATITANHPRFLETHLLQVIQAINRAPGFELYGIGIDYDVCHFYPRSINLQSVDELGPELIDFVGEALLTHNDPA